MKYPSGRLTVRCSVSPFIPVTTELTLKTLESMEKAELLCYLHISIHSKRCHRGGGGFGQLTRAWPIQTLHSCLLSVFTLHFPPVVDEKLFLLRSILYTVFFFQHWEWWGFVYTISLDILDKSPVYQSSTDCHIPKDMKFVHHIWPIPWWTWAAAVVLAWESLCDLTSPSTNT